ncbi:3-oxoacyl-[acyl-carrier-protein] synthase 3 [Planctomycetes bacterium Pan216]|uniref:3-oxoacyl-[acyl-carrier-protein] synthase 3 n=1 Tax=Kolteria novifilia TaxID=2527975 RepID=A0A518B694_9BACT|nr:3-oxoacyl-[acyl-carrier-protein] synthase 3 [Planctomycetes bacterium Pan216]
MRYQNVRIDSFAYNLPDEIVSSEEIERRLAPLYGRLGLREGRLELMSGIKERRFFPAGTLPGPTSCETARQALEASSISAEQVGCLIHASVCRDYMEPATACRVHHELGLPEDATLFDLSNACLGFMNAMTQIANMIELGQIEAGLVVSTESSRDLVEATIDLLNRDESLKRNDIKDAFASLTIGSASVAAVLTHQRLSPTGPRLLGGAYRSATAHHALCRGGPDASLGESRPLMKTDSETMLVAGCDLARETWEKFRREMHWADDVPERFFAHQVGSAHRRRLCELLKLDPDKDLTTLEWLGNTGSAALPTTTALAIEQGFLRPGDRFAMLGIGSGLTCMMLAGEMSPSHA